MTRTLPNLKAIVSAGTFVKPAPPPRLPAQYRRRWSEEATANLKALVAQMSYAQVAKRLRRTETAVFKRVNDLGGLRRIALEANLIGGGALTRLLRKAEVATIGYWRSLGLPARLLGGLSSGGGRGNQKGPTRTRGSYFYSLPEVIAFLKSHAGGRLIVTLHPDARRLLKLEMPTPPGGWGPKQPAPSQTPEYRRARYAPIPKIPCEVCGHGLIASLTVHNVCTTTQKCRDERQRRIWVAIKARAIVAGTRQPPRKCTRCGGELLPTAKRDVCKRNPDCKRENDRLYALTRNQRRRKPAANPLTLSPRPQKEVA